MKKIIFRAIKISAIFLGSLVLLFFAFVLLVYTGVFGPIPGEEELGQIKNEEASLVYSSDGELIGKYFSENRTNVSMEEIPTHLVQALVATEDKRFFKHRGIDRRSYLRVLIKTILLGDRSGGGGSTISQQLAKNLFGRNSYGILSLPVIKTREAIIARRLESVYSKNEILLLYLNSVPFGEEVYGVEAAANRYFDKVTRDLNIQESALLIGLLKANTYYNPRLNPDNALKRRNQVLDLMTVNGDLTEEAADSLSHLPLGLQYSNLSRDTGYEYFVFQVKKQVSSILLNLVGQGEQEYDIRKDGLKIYTTLDYRIQELALQATSSHLATMQALLDKELAARNSRKSWEQEFRKRPEYNSEYETVAPREVFDWKGIKVTELSRMDSIWHYYSMLNAAVLVTDPQSGAILGWVGGNHYRYLPYDLVLAEHQLASVVKPLIYSAALEEGMTPCTYLENSEREYQNYQGWHPANYDHSSTPDSAMAMWYALANSVNLPTIDLYFQTGHDRVRDLMTRLGIDVPETETPAISIGAVDASLYQAVRAYGMFANEGRVSQDLSMIMKITDANGKVLYENKRVKEFAIIREQTAEMITAMLAGAINSGTGTGIRNRFGISSDLAGKTGTSQNYSDAWFIAYTPSLVVGTWVGARSKEVHFHSGLGSGSALALPISGYLLQKLEQDDVLAAEYLTPFNLPGEIYAEIDCDAFREKGIKGVLDRLMGKDDQPSKKEKRKKEGREDREKKGVKGFFKRIFGKKDKK